MTDSPPRSGAQAVERAITILRCFVSTSESLGITELATATGLTISTVHRIVRVLTHEGLLVQDARGERYLLGPTLVMFGRHAQEQLGYSRAQPILDELAAETGESVNLGIRTGNEVQIVLHAASPQPLRFDQVPGTRVPLNVSAMGKCFLAYSGSIDDQLAGLGPLSGATEKSITNRKKLAEELQAVRRRGWALNDEERNPGVRAVAVPVLHHSGTAVAAVAVQGPTVRMTDDEVPRLARTAGQKVARIAALLVGD